VARTTPGQNRRSHWWSLRRWWATQHRMRLVAHRQRCRPRLRGEGPPLLTTASARRRRTASWAAVCNGAQRRSWRENALDMTTIALSIPGHRYVPRRGLNAGHFAIQTVVAQGRIAQTDRHPTTSLANGQSRTLCGPTRSPLRKGGNAREPSKAPRLGQARPFKSGPLPRCVVPE
jgi:hypothetical protein